MLNSPEQSGVCSVIQLPTFLSNFHLLTCIKTKQPENPINSMYVSIETYLDGKSSLHEIFGIMRGTDLTAGKLAGIMRQLSDYGDRDRYSSLYRECRLFGLY